MMGKNIERIDHNEKKIIEAGIVKTNALLSASNEYEVQKAMDMIIPNPDNQYIISEIDYEGKYPKLEFMKHCNGSAIKIIATIHGETANVEIKACVIASKMKEFSSHEKITKKAA